MNELEVITTDKVTEYLDAFGFSGDLSKQEKAQFIGIAKEFQLNPFKREIYCIPYGSGDYRKLSIITGYEVYLKRADRTGKLAGWGVEFFGNVKTEIHKVEKTGKNGKYFKDVKVPVGDLRAVITIHRKDWDKPFTHTAYLEEYAQENEMWGVKPRTMLGKVVTGQGFRLAFPDEIGGLPYLEEENGLTDEPRNVTPEPEKSNKKAEPKPEADPWLAERETRMNALTPIVLKFSKEARETLELKSLLTRAVKEPVCMDIAEIRTRIYGKYKDSEFIANILDAILAFGIDMEKLLGYESGMTVPVEAQEVTKGEADGPGEESQLF
jgi:phage recombination protein Bet